MYCCYVLPSQISGNTIHIDNSERHHLINVLRLKRGDEVQVFDGEGNSYNAVLGDTRSSVVNASICHHQFYAPNSPQITLFQGLPKSDKLQLIVQKTTEIGVDQIVPMICQRSIPKQTVATQKKRQARWQRIAIEAAKQCKRPRFPKVLDTRKITDCFEMATHLDLSILFWENEENQEIKVILQNHRQIRSVGLFIGPEGGFSDEEVEDAIQSGCIPARLGDNILRTETAAIVGVALVVYELRGL